MVTHTHTHTHKLTTVPSAHAGEGNKNPRDGICESVFMNKSTITLKNLYVHFILLKQAIMDAHDKEMKTGKKREGSHDKACRSKKPKLGSLV